MAEYTIELRTIVESGVQIFDFPYDFYDESKRRKFEENFIRHFYFREIGSETIDRFKWYLQDKMNVVFPYYNELFKSAAIKYDVLDNYKLTETYTRNVENNSKGGGVSSTVGRTTDEQKTETDENRTVDTTGNVVDDKLVETQETGKTTTTNSETANNESTSTSTTNGTTSTTKEGTETTNNETTEKFLDTPQGAVDLSDTRYLTSLKGVNTSSTQNSNSSESGTNNQTTQGSGTSETATNGESESNTTRNGKTTDLTITDTTGKEKTDGKISTVANAEQISSQDNNTRHYATGESSETYTLTRRGNIGVDTDSDAIEKHNRLQKTLRNIEKMFFDECEDLFMLVY